MFVWIFITMMVLDIIYCKGGVIMKHDEKDLKNGKGYRWIPGRKFYST